MLRVSAFDDEAQASRQEARSPSEPPHSTDSQTYGELSVASTFDDNDRLPNLVTDAAVPTTAPHAHRCLATGSS